MVAQTHLAHQGTAFTLVVDGQPTLLLAGELGNSSASSPSDIRSNISKAARLGLNTILVPAYWDLTEPTEGTFDFSLTDSVITCAREHNLHVIFLWFGAWKNSMSCYAPSWFKTDYTRFPRAHTKDGTPLEIASAFSPAVLQADKQAFTHWVQHIADVDKEVGTVVMLQIENEIGMLTDARDYSPLATQAFQAEGYHGGDIYEDERFMAAHYAAYVEQLARVAKDILPVPLYVNAALNSRNRVPGEYPSAGPLAHLMDIWQSNAPSIDIIAPDIYDSGYTDWLAQYDTPSNPLFIPEIQLAPSNAVRAFYAFGQHNCIGFSPFSIEDADPEGALPRAYGILRQLTPYITRLKGQNRLHGYLLTPDDTSVSLTDDDLLITASHYFTLPWDPRATDGHSWEEAGGIIIKLNTYEYLIAGSGFVLSFEKADKNSPFQQGILSVDEVSIAPDGSIQRIRSQNGDQDHQGRHVRIPVDEYRILHVRLYEYK